jgi:hypothetical protein
MGAAVVSPPACASDAAFAFSSAFTALLYLFANPRRWCPGVSRAPLRPDRTSSCRPSCRSALACFAILEKQPLEPALPTGEQLACRPRQHIRSSGRGWSMPRSWWNRFLAAQLLGDAIAVLSSCRAQTRIRLLRRPGKDHRHRQSPDARVHRLARRADWHIWARHTPSPSATAMVAVLHHDLISSSIALWRRGSPGVSRPTAADRRRVFLPSVQGRCRDALPPPENREWHGQVPGSVSPNCSSCSE